MTDLTRALTDIHSIRRQLADSTEFRGYGPITLAATSLLALAAATIQDLWLPDAPTHRLPYLILWVATAILSAALIATEMFARTRRIHSGLADHMLHTAVQQFLPAAASGALLTLAIPRFAPATIWILPGLWQIVFALGIFASTRFLPRAIAYAGAWYLLTGLTLIALADTRALSPWAMGIPYATGQLLIAAILFFHARREPHGA